LKPVLKCSLIIPFLILLIDCTPTANNSLQNTKNIRPIQRDCIVTFKDDSNYKVKNYYLQSKSDRVDYKDGLIIKYTDDQRGNDVFYSDFILIEIQSGLFQKISFSEIDKLLIIRQINKTPKCKIKLLSGENIEGVYDNRGMKLDHHYKFKMTSLNGEDLLFDSDRLNKIQRVPNNTDLWNISYIQRPKIFSAPWDTINLTVTNINWTSKKSTTVSTLKKYGESETIDYLDLKIDSETNKYIKIKFRDMAKIEFSKYDGKRIVTLLDSTIIKGKELKNAPNKYFYGKVNDNLTVFAPITWGLLKSVEFK
jgi:hypothetical protein